MKRAAIIVGAMIFIGIVWRVVFAGSQPEPSVGLYWYSSADPTSGGGVAAPMYQLLVRTDNGSIYYKSGSSNTAWTLIGTSGPSGITGTGTNGTYMLWNTSTSATNGNISETGGNTTLLTDAFVQITHVLNDFATINAGDGTFAHAADVNIENAIGSGLGSGLWDLKVDDIRPAAAGNGGNVQFFDNVATGFQTGVIGGEIKLSKETNTSGDATFDLIIGLINGGTYQQVLQLFAHGGAMLNDSSGQGVQTYLTSTTTAAAPHTVANIYMQGQNSTPAPVTVVHEYGSFDQKTAGSEDGRYQVDVIQNGSPYGLINCVADHTNAGKMTCQFGSGAADGEFFMGGNTLDINGNVITGGSATLCVTSGCTGGTIGCYGGVCNHTSGTTWTVDYNEEIGHNSKIDNELDVVGLLYMYPSSTFEANGDSFFNFRVRQSGGTAAITSGCGTGASIQGGSLGGTILLGTTAGTCVLTFANSFGVTPSLVVTCRSGVGIAYTPSATTLTLTATGRDGDTCSWIVVGNG